MDKHEINSIRVLEIFFDRLRYPIIWGWGNILSNKSVQIRNSTCRKVWGLGRGQEFDGGGEGGGLKRIQEDPL